jgi:hypothetical protein
LRQLCSERRKFHFVELSPTVSLLYLSREHDRHYRLDYLCASCDWNRREQVCEMANPQQTCARAGSDGPGTPGKIAQSHEARPRHGGAARVNAAIPHKLTIERLDSVAPHNVILSEAKNLG